MARDNLKNLMASLESAEGDVDTTLTDSMEAEMLEMEEADREVEESASDVEELEEIADGLESIAASLEAASSEGGLDESAAKFLGLAVEGYTARVGLEASAIIPSVESFGGATGRASATEISLESLKENIKKVWNAIKAAVQRAIEAVQNFFAKIFSNVDKMIDRAKGLETKVAGLGNKKAEGKVKVPGASALHVGGKVDAGSIATGLENLRRYAEESIPEIVAGSVSYYDGIAAKLASSEVQKFMEENAVNEMLKETTEKYVTTTTKIAAKGKEMSGGARMHMDGESADADRGAVTMKMMSLKKEGSAKEGQEIDVPSPEQLKKIVGDTLGVLNAIKGKKKNIEDLKKARQETVKKSDTFVSAGEGNRLGKAWTQAKVSLALRSANKDLARPVQQLSSHAWTSSRAAMALVERSVAAYK